MGPRSAARSAAERVYAWTLAQWVDACMWGVLALGIFFVTPDSVPAALCMSVSAALAKPLPRVAFAAVIAVGAVVAGPTGDLESTFAVAIAPACYLARRQARDWWMLGPAAVALAIYVSEAAIGGNWGSRPGTSWGRIADGQMNPAIFIAAAILGLGLGFASNALDRARLLEIEKESLRTRTEASEEHGRWLELRRELARELHDLVGHHVTAMVVRAEAGLVDDPHRALTEIGDSGRRALGELDSLVGYLRDPSNDGPITSVQRLENVDSLVLPLQRQGVVVEVSVDRSLQLGPSAELAAYRIVQEAITNIARHARATAAWVTVEDTAGHIRVRVSDDGVGPPAANTRGSGLDGIGERVAAHHGMWAIGVRHGGGTTLDAYLAKEVVTP